MSETATQANTFSIGDKVAERYEIVQELPPQFGRPQYEVKDLQEPGASLTLSQIGKPTKEAESDKVKRGLERAVRVASWMRTPGALIPKDFLYVDGILYSVTSAPHGVPLAKYIKENSPAPNQIVGWMLELAAVLAVFHDARQPQFLGRIPLENLWVTPEEQILLTGFDMGPEFKIEFRAQNEETPKAPDQRLDSRSDVWALGSLLQACMETSSDEVKKAFRAETDLRSLVATMINPDPDKRVPNMATLKTRFERVNWSKAPKLSNTGFSDAPIKVLTVEDKSPWADFKEAYRFWILVAVMVALAFIMVLQFIFPPEI